MLRSPQITSINFADALAHSLLSTTDRVSSPRALFVEAFVTHVPSADGYSCGFAALAGCADATPRFLQAIDPTHCLKPRH